MEGIEGPRRRRAFERDWTKGSIVHNLWSLAWPMTISGAISTLGYTFDMVWVGRLGAASIAGVGIAGMVVMLMDSLKEGLVMGMRALVARLVGAGDFEGASRVAQQAFVISAAYSIAVAAMGISLAEPILLLFGVEPDVVTQGAAYMRIAFAGRLSMGLYMMARGTMQASGDAVIPMRIDISYMLFHVALCPFLVFGWWLFPRMGVSGAALTNVFSTSLAMSLGLWVLLTGRSRLRLSLRNFRLDGNIIWRIMKIGIPAMITGAERNFVNVVMIRLVSPFGTFAVAGHSLVQRIDGFMHMPTMGFGQAAGVLAGQNLGAGQPERAARTGWIGTGLVASVMLIGSAAIWFWAEWAVRIFNTEPSLVEIGSTFMRIEIASYLVFGPLVVLSQCLNGVGDTLPVMLATLITMWGVQMPLAYFLPRITNLGVYGVRWGMVSAMVIRAVIYTTYFKLGRWKRKQV